MMSDSAPSASKRRYVMHVSTIDGHSHFVSPLSDKSAEVTLRNLLKDTDVIPFWHWSPAWYDSLPVPTTKQPAMCRLFVKSRHQAARGARVFASANTEGRERLVWREPVNQAAIRRPRQVAVA